jgi:HlyD family secretion protein
MRKSRRSKYVWLLLLVLLSFGFLSLWRHFPAEARQAAYQLAPVERGAIIQQVKASGTLSAVTTVQVGSQVSGTISELFADYNSTVRKGQLLAKLDPILFETLVEQAEATVRACELALANDQANVAAARAALQNAKVDVANKQRKLRLQAELMAGDLTPRDDLETARAESEASAASRNAAEARLESAQAACEADKSRLKGQQANLENAKVNLEHTLIYSPVSGTVISRNVDRGQTVAASMATPTLFTIGEDLTRMQVSTRIDESDVGKMRAGMPASFTVEAYPDEVFEGRVGQVRLATTSVQNVVSYEVMVEVANPQLKLKPGMTARVRATVAMVPNALKVPNAALRFRPDSETGQAGRSGREGTVWLLRPGDTALCPVRVELGLTDGSSTQITSKNLPEGGMVAMSVDGTKSKDLGGPPPGEGGGPPPPPP